MPQNMVFLYSFFFGFNSHLHIVTDLLADCLLDVVGQGRHSPVYTPVECLLLHDVHLGRFPQRESTLANLSVRPVDLQRIEGIVKLLVVTLGQTGRSLAVLSLSGAGFVQDIWQCGA